MLHPPNGGRCCRNGLRVQFTDKSNTGTTSDRITRHFWNFGGLGASSAASPVFQFATGGTYQVELTVTDDDGSRQFGSARSNGP
ncbi:MAG: PKD domain-containing protein [Pirellulaceae bacterium]